MTAMQRLCVLILMFLLPAFAQAEQKKVYGEYEVHYAVMLTSDLTPEVARTYDIPRSTKRAYIMVHTRKTADDGSSRSVATRIEGKVNNLVGQVRQLQWREVEENGAIYSLSHFPVTNRERLNFRLEVTPADSQRALPLDFQQQFFTE